MTRPITESELQAYVDDALDAPRRAEVADYLDRHRDIAQRIAGYTRQRATLRAALAPIADEPIPPQLDLAQLVAARRPPWPWRWAVAAIVLVGVSGAGGWLLRDRLAPAAPASSGIAALAQEASDSYRVYAPERAHPVELRDPAELARWISERIAHPVSIPDLTQAGYRFMGGRVVATTHGPAGLLMYDDDHGTRVVLLIRPMAVERDTAMALHTSGALRGYSWAARGIGYSVVAVAAPETLHPLADEVRRQIAAG